MTTRRLRIPPRWRSLLPFAGIAMVVGGLAGARITGTAALELQRNGGRYALATMCVGVGQGTAVLIERV